MSKSIGNVVDPRSVIEVTSASETIMACLFLVICIPAEEHSTITQVHSVHDEKNGMSTTISPLHRHWGNVSCHSIVCYACNVGLQGAFKLFF